MKQLGSDCSLHFGRVSNKPDFGKAMGFQLLIIVTLTDNLVVFATLAESFFSINYCLENMKETQ